MCSIGTQETKTWIQLLQHKIDPRERLTTGFNKFRRKMFDKIYIKARQQFSKNYENQNFPGA